MIVKFRYQDDLDTTIKYNFKTHAYKRDNDSVKYWNTERPSFIWMLNNWGIVVEFKFHGEV